MSFDDVIKELGEFGPYQRRLMLLTLFPQILFALQQMLPVFILSEHTHRCRKSYWLLATTNLSSPAVVQSVSSCDVTVYYNATNTTQQERCDSWTYDTDKLISSPISDFDLVCDETILRTHASMAFLGGNLASALLMGTIGDTFGRKPVACFSAILLVLSSVACRWSTDFYMYVIMRFLSGIGSNIACFKVIAIEMVGPSWRAFAGMSFEIVFCVGELVLTGLAYLLRDWRDLQLAISVPGALLLLYWFVLPESARWLLSRGKVLEAKQLLTNISKVNHRKIPKIVDDVENFNTAVKHNVKEIAPMFKSPKHLARWFITMFTWFVLATAYYGLSFHVGTIGGNVYLNFSIFALVEGAGAFITLFFSNRIGRKTLNTVALFSAGILSGLSMLASLYIQDETTRMWILVSSGTVGRMIVSGDFANIFILTSEMFPTSIRSFAVATANVAGMIGATVAPYIADVNQFLQTDFGLALPFLVFGSLTFLAGFLSLALPETLHKTLPEGVRDITFGVTTLSKQIISIVDPQRRMDIQSISIDTVRRTTYV